ncbi:alpha/beta hydrolase [uncultured Microscilla sp.]|uniref:alpha/beta hydrolase family protein n=1 Tax=uncultured Microscilla sp. TaxID=432653 RepID=UPI002631B9A0|nr:alpha/beta hydrolase [uncultured Microscilla sp.]
MKSLKCSLIFMLITGLSWQCIQAQQLPRRAFLGAQLQNVTEAQQKELSLPNTQGVYLARIVPESSLALAKVKPGDILTAINQYSIINVRQFIPLLKQFKASDKVRLTYYRQGKKRQTQMTFQEFPKMKSKTYEVIYSSVKANANHLRTIITKPKGNGKYPAVLIVQGLGCATIDSPVNRFSKAISDSLTGKGMVVMQVEKTGMGDSQGTPCRECSFEEEVEGYLQGIKALKKMPYVDANQVFMLGFSMGGVIAPIVASQMPVKGIIAYGTVGGRNWLEYEMENTRRQAEMAGTPYDEISVIMQAKEKALHYLMVEKQATQDIIAKYPETAPHLRYPQHNQYLRSVGGLNLAKNWLKINAHVLVVHGKADFVSFAKDHALIAKIVNSKHPGKATYIELPNSDHWLNAMKTMQRSRQNRRNRNNAKNYRLLSIVSSWILEKVRAS